MHTLSRYLLRNLTVPFALTVIVILLALSLERFLRIIDVVVGEGASFGAAISLLAYLQPHYLGLAIPAALFLSVMLAFRKMHEQSELVVMQSAGMPYGLLIRPALLFSLVMMIVMFLIVAFGQPIGRYSYRAELQNVSAGYQTLRVKPGVFQKIGDDITLRADRVSRDGSVLFGFFADVQKDDNTLNDGDYAADGKRRTFILASQAIVVSPKELKDIKGADKRLTILLQDGQIIQEKPGEDPSLLSVNAYPWRLPVPPHEPYGVRGQDEREMTLPELFSGGPDNVNHDIERGKMQAELHARLVSVLSLPVLAFLALPLSLIGSGRSGKATGIVLGVLILILYEKILGIGETMVRNDVVSPALAVWFPFTVIASVSVILFLRLAGVTVKEALSDALYLISRTVRGAP
ncbi:MAG: LptF/LptG family permease [Alphaproteobacteria bacterium]|nr:LptF/LptG family permease [Alphaproteobacteria bacterium]MDP7222105.1 LptF/LptG family permease [Alphaproteobacteria bacterium]